MSANPPSFERPAFRAAHDRSPRSSSGLRAAETHARSRRRNGEPIRERAATGHRPGISPHLPTRNEQQQPAPSPKLRSKILQPRQPRSIVMPRQPTLNKWRPRQLFVDENPEPFETLFRETAA